MNSTDKNITTIIDTWDSGLYEYGPDIQDVLTEKIDTLSESVQKDCIRILLQREYKTEAVFVKNTYFPDSCIYEYYR